MNEIMFAGILTLTTFLLIESAQGVQNVSLTAIQIVNVHGNSTTQRIDVVWKDVPGKQNKVIYRIEVYYTGQKEAIHAENVERGPNLTHHWHWISPLPLQCLSHSVRLRHYNATEWVEGIVSGSGPDYLAVPKIYPEDRGFPVYPVGILKKFCCIIPNGTTLSKLSYNYATVNRTRVGQTYLFDLEMVPTNSWGYDILCWVHTKSPTKSRAGITVFASYSPQVNNFTCETRNLRSLQCSWKQGNDRNLEGDKTRTYYALNGSSCGNEKCSVEITPKQGEATWTLTARNRLGEANFTFAADPRHRVYLQAPVLQGLQVNSRNATIRLQWPDDDLTSLKMRCEVNITAPTKPEEVREETLEYLRSVTLYLHPYTSYSVQVRCTSDEFFWKWGDWSKEIKFQTKEDIPHTVNVWMTADGNQRFVVWKRLTPQLCHGRLMGYEVLWSGSAPRRLNPTEQCYNMSAGNAQERISITALNSVGRSQPSEIVIPSHTRDVDTKRVNSSDGGLELTWAPSPRASGGYVVDWYPVNRQSMCDIDWIKIPDGRTNITVKSGIEDGVLYNISLYANTSDAPVLLQRWEGYGRELAPNESPHYFHAEQDGMDIILTWGEIPLENRRGFIQGYTISYTLNSKNVIISVSDGMQKRIPHLRADMYEFQICGFTSGGCGVQRKTTVKVISQISQIIVYTIISFGAVITLFLLSTILCYWKRAWLKDKVYPDIPAPQLKWLDPKIIHGGKLVQELPAERVEPVIASPIPVCDPNLKVTNYSTDSVLLPIHRNVSGPQPSTPAHYKFNSSMDAFCSELDNPTYKLLVLTNEAGKDTTITTPEVPSLAVTTQGYKPQLLPQSAPMSRCTSSSYQALMDVCQGGGQQETAWTSQVESDDYIALGLLGSPTSVSSSQPLLGDPYRFGHVDSH